LIDLLDWCNIIGGIYIGLEGLAPQIRTESEIFWREVAKNGVSPKKTSLKETINYKND
jgi:hypothetical protein